MESAKVDPKTIDHFILGSVVPTTTDALYGGRHLALKSGGRENVPGYNVNRLCGSGAQVILDAVHMLLLGEANAVIAAGTENMSNVPHLVYGSRFGTKYGPLKTVDMLMDSLTDKNAGCAMGITAENLANKYGITREQAEAFSLSSHLKAAKAYEEGNLQGEIASFATKRGGYSG